MSTKLLYRATGILVCCLLAIAGIASPPHLITRAQDALQPIIVEAESYTGETGGQLEIMQGRTASSGEQCIAYWDNEGHAVDWVFDVPVAGDYGVVLRYAQGRTIDVYRELQIDGETIQEQIVLPPTGGFSKGSNDWVNLTVADEDGMPLLVTLTEGEHALRLINAGGAGGEKPSANLDFVAFIPPDFDPAALTADMDAAAAAALPSFPPGYISTNTLKAFPGAEGFGSDTVHGRGGQVIEVTNLNDSGPGSLREAAQTPGPRIIVFRVGGTIQLTENIMISEPYVYIAGQTAPGDGIALTNGGLHVATHDVVIRYMRVRPGDDPNGELPDKRDGVAVDWKYAYNVVVDHCSFSWSIDENMSTWQEIYNVTYQWNIIAEALFHSIHPEGPHSMGMLIGDDATNVSIHHNLFAHNNQRNPLIKSGSYADVVNNVVYNWGLRALDTSDWYETGNPVFANVVNNYFKPGVNSDEWEFTIQEEGVQGHIVNESKFYLSGNIGPHRPTDTGDEWVILNNTDPAYRSDEPFSAELVTTWPAQEAYGLVLASAGAVYPARDAVDVRIVSEVLTGSGQIIDSVSQTPGFPDLQSAEPPADNDHDGMPDEWEIAHGLNPSDAADGVLDQDGDGYTNVEEYINSLVVAYVLVPAASVDDALPTIPVEGPALAEPQTEEATLLWSDSFETGNEAGHFPADWDVLDADGHTEGETGAIVVETSDADGAYAIKLVSKPTKETGFDGRMRHDFDPVVLGQLEVMAMVSAEDAGFLSVELRAGGDRIFNLEMHQDGYFRYRDQNGDNQEAGVDFAYDQWYTLVIQWDANASLWHAFYRDDAGELVRITPEEGVGFATELAGQAPDRVQLRVNRADDGIHAAYVDAFALYQGIPASVAAAADQEPVALWSDSFETGNEAAHFPADWDVLDADGHTEGETGAIVIETSDADGAYAVELVSKPTKETGFDGRMRHDFDPVALGQLEVMAMVPAENAGFLSIELRAGGDRIFNLEMHQDGYFRYRDQNGDNQEAGVDYAYDQWYALVIQWDANASVWHAFYRDDAGELVRITPEEGVGFATELAGQAPDRVQLRVNRADDGIHAAYVDAFALYSLD